MTEQLRQDIDAYNNAKVFIDHLKRTHGITRQQFTTLRGQALAGDIDGAFKGLRKIIDRQEGKRA